MGVAQSIVPNIFSTDAHWRTYCQAFEDALLASGFLTVAPDTGQLDLTSAVRPAAGTYAGYRIYQAVDDLAALYPLMVKVEYGVSTGVQTRPKISLTAAPTSNGAGTLVSPVSTAANPMNATQDGGGNARIFGSGLEQSSAWVYVHDPSVGNNCGFLVIGRLISVEDAQPRPAVRWMNLGTSTSLMMSNAVFTDGGSWGASSLNLYEYYPNLGHPLCTGGDINNTLLYQGTLYRNTETLTFPVLAGRTAELPFSDPDASAFTIDIWGETHTFVPLPQGAFQGSNMRSCVPWE